MAQGLSTFVRPGYNPNERTAMTRSRRRTAERHSVRPLLLIALERLVVCIATLTFVGGLSILSSRVAAGQARSELIGPTQTIPNEPYKTWSLFLVCTPD